MYRFLSLLIVLMLFVGCTSNDNLFLGAEDVEPSIVNFTVAGIADYTQSDSVSSKRALLSDSFSVNNPMLASTPLIGDACAMAVNITPEAPVQTRSTFTRASLAEEIRYRVIAYKSVDNSYAGHADYKINGGNSVLVSGGLKLANGDYRIVAYSYQNSNPIFEDPESGKVNVSLNDDFLYWEGNVSLNGNISVFIYFRRLFPQLKVVFDSTDIATDFTEASASLGLSSGNLYRKGIWNIASNAISDLMTVNTPVFSFGEVSGTNIVSNYQSLLPLPNQEIALTVNAKLGNGTSVTKTLNLPPKSFLSNYAYTCTVKFKPPGVSLADEPMDANGNSYGGGNCWVLPVSDLDKKYMFDATKEGQTNDNVGTTVTTVNTTRGAKVVWMDSPGLISEATWNNGVITLAVGANHTGNAIVAVTDGPGTSGKILWSWHIWVVPDNSFMRASVTAGTFLDRNLGAVSATSGNANSYGLIYQWGRKDPMRRESGINQVAGGKTIAYSVENPDQFIYKTTAPYNWCTQDLDFWSSTYIAKYNPCPKGWLVMPETSYTSFFTGNGGTWNAGYVWSGVYFPAAGARSRVDGKVNNVGVSGYYLSSKRLDGGNAFVLMLTSSSVYKTSMTRAEGCPIRCVRE